MPQGRRWLRGVRFTCTASSLRAMMCLFTCYRVSRSTRRRVNDEAMSGLQPNCSEGHEGNDKSSVSSPLATADSGSTGPGKPRKISLIIAVCFTNHLSAQAGFAAHRGSQLAGACGDFSRGKLIEKLLKPCSWSARVELQAKSWPMLMVIPGGGGGGSERLIHRRQNDWEQGKQS